MLYEMFVQIFVEILFFGPGYLISKYALRVEDVELDSFFSDSISVLFWVMAIFVFVAVFLG